MKKYLRFTLLMLCLLASLFSLGAQAEVSERNELAIFSLGYYGYDIPAEALGTIDIEIQKVFIDLGRFTIMGMTQRFDSASVNDFIASIKKTKEENFVMPDEFLFGEAFFTDAEYNRLLGAFIIAIPVVTNFNSEKVNNVWETDIKTNVSFINVQSGEMIGIADVETSGSSRETQFKSVKDAIDGIPNQLQFEIRKIPTFQIRTKVLAVQGSRIDLQLGSAMGIKKGDEYAVKSVVDIGGFTDESEVGLILIKEVRENTSTGLIRYSSVRPGPDTQLQEIPRLGFDTSVFVHAYKYLLDSTNEGALVAGVRAEATRGFFDIKPFAAVSVYLDMAKWFPINIFAGGEYSMYLGRLELGARAGIGGSANILVNLLEDSFSSSDDKWFTHYGATAGAYLSFLLSRDTKLFVEVQGEYMMGFVPLNLEAFEDFGGYGGGIGVSFKL